MSVLLPVKVNFDTIESPKFRCLQTLFLLGVCLVIYVWALLNGEAQTCGKVASVLLIFTSAWLVFRTLVQKNTLLMMVFLFMMLYTFPAKVFFFNQIPFAAHYPYLTYNTALSTTLLFALSLILVNGFIRVNKPSMHSPLKFVDNDLLFLALVALGLVITVVGVKGESLLSGEAYGVAEKESSSLNEYGLIIFMFAYRYTGGKRLNLWVLTLLLLFYSAKNLLLGGRIEVLMLFLLLFTLRFQYTFSFKKVMLLFVVGAWAMTAFATVRSNPLLVLEGDVWSIINPFSSTASVRTYQGGNEGDVYWASERMLVLMDKDMLDTPTRVSAGSKYFLSVFFPVSLLGEEAYMARYKVDVISSGGGGLAPIYFYVFGGLLGVFLFSFFVAKIFSKTDFRGSAAVNVYVVLLVMTIPRWFAYYPLHLIKFCVWGVLVFYIVESVNFTMKKRLNLPLNKIGQE